MQTIAQKFIGLDVHKDSISAAVAEGGTFAPSRDLGRIAHDVPRLLKLLKRVGEPEELQVAYEAGPTGYGLCRALRTQGIDCIVAAPSKTPLPRGVRIKTDRLDARVLAESLRCNRLKAIDVPGVEAEGLRDFVRLREDALWALQKSRQQLRGFLLRHGRVYTGKSSWTDAHISWIRAQRFGLEAQRSVLEQYLAEAIRQKEWLDQLTERLVELIGSTPQSRLYTYLQALRGVHTICSGTIVAEIGDLRRFEKASQFMSYLGLTPSIHASGDHVRRGRITKAGNAHVRRVLIEAAWSARYRPARSAQMQLRLARVPVEIQDIAWKAQVRLHQRYLRMLKRGKTQQQTIVAIARELAGFVWAIGQKLPNQAA